MNTPISSGFRDAMPFQYPWTPRSHGRSPSGGSVWRLALESRARRADGSPAVL